MTNKSTPDLSTVKGVQAYIIDTPFTSTEILPLSGGSANYVFRLTLEKPYEGRTTLILKHGKSYAKDRPEVALPVDRQVSVVISFLLKRIFILGRAVDIRSRSTKTRLCVDPRRGDCNSSAGTSSRRAHVRDHHGRFWTFLHDSQGIHDSRKGIS